MLENSSSLKICGGLTGKEGLKKYENWDSKDIATAFIRKFFSIPRNPGSKIQYAYYNFPIFADSPVVKFIKLPKFTGNNYKQEIIECLNKVVKQELSRIKLVQERREIDSILPINNYDTNGDKFHFFPELNNYIVDENGTKFIDAIIEARKNEDIKKIYNEFFLMRNMAKINENFYRTII